MEEIHPGYLIGLLVFLILCSAFFSSVETGMLSLDRYRLRHLSKQGNRGARRTGWLLLRTDRLLGTILIGNNFVNIIASSLATLLALRLWGEAGVAIATIALTLVLLIFGEITPKTYAALRPETVTVAASLPLIWTTLMAVVAVLALVAVIALAVLVALAARLGTAFCFCLGPGLPFCLKVSTLWTDGHSWSGWRCWLIPSLYLSLSLWL